MFWAVYRVEHPFFEQHKIEKNKPWAWNVDRDNWIQKLKACGLTVCTNLTLSVFVCHCICGAAYGWHYPFADFDLETIPSEFTLFIQTMICIICDDFCFYWGHRLMHVKH